MSVLMGQQPGSIKLLQPRLIDEAAEGGPEQPMVMPGALQPNEAQPQSATVARLLDVTAA